MPRQQPFETPLDPQIQAGLQAAAQQQAMQQQAHLQSCILLLETAKACYPSAVAAIDMDNLKSDEDYSERPQRFRQEIADEAVKRAHALLSACGIQINFKQGG